MLTLESLNWPSIIKAIHAHRNNDQHALEEFGFIKERFAKDSAIEKEDVEKGGVEKGGVEKDGYWMPVMSSDQAAVYYCKEHAVFAKIFYETRFKHKVKNFILPSTSRYKRFIDRTNDLHRLSIPAPTIIASGSIDQNGYVITSAFPGMGLGSFFARFLSPEINDRKIITWRREVVISLGKLVANLHNAGISHGDLRPNNILLNCCSLKPKFCFIDNERNSKLDKELRIKNLVQLNMIWLGDLSLFDRFRFARSYFKSINTSQYHAYLSIDKQKELVRIIKTKTEERLAEKSKEGYRKIIGFEPFLPDLKKLLDKTASEEK